MPKLKTLCIFLAAAQISGMSVAAEPAPSVKSSESSIRGLTPEQQQRLAAARKAQASKGYSEQQQAAIDLAVQTVNERTPIEKDSIEDVQVRGMQWTDSSLGCPQPGQQYLQKTIPGYIVSFRTNGQDYSVNTGDGNAVICEQIHELLASRRARGQAIIQAQKAARIDLAAKLMVDVEQVQVVKMKLETFEDSSLGCPVTGQQYQPGPIEGITISMSCRDRQYEYRSDLQGGNFISCEEIVSCHETE